MIVALISDLVLKSKVVETAKQLQCELVVVRSGDDFLKNLKSSSVSSYIVDLNIKNVEVFELLRQAHEICAEAQAVGFFSHVEHEIGRQAEALGFVKVMPRSKFFGQLAEIIEAGSLLGSL